MTEYKHRTLQSVKHTKDNTEPVKRQFSSHTFHCKSHAQALDDAFTWELSELHQKSL